MQPYAVISTGGKQYQVHAGDVLQVEKISGKKEGDTVELPALAVHDGSDMLAGTPVLSRPVQACVVSESRAKKILVLKKIKKKQNRSLNGHRQAQMAIRIESIPID